MDSNPAGEEETALREPAFTIEHESSPSNVLIAGFSAPGLAGLTAVDFLVDRLELVETGHVEVEQLPAITPFENGTPRHHTRFFSRPDLEITVLAGELFVPGHAARSLSDALFEWVEANRVDEIVLVSGIPFRHGPDEHRTFYVATADYQETRLVETDVPPMGGGFLDGIGAEILLRGMASPLSACVYATPVHERVPDIEAAIRLVETVIDTYDLPADSGPLRQFAEEIAEYYAELSTRVEQAKEQQKPEDRMFM